MDWEHLATFLGTRELLMGVKMLERNVNELRRCVRSVHPNPLLRGEPVLIRE